MFTVSEIAPSGVLAGQTKSQQQVIASVLALQRVIAVRSGSESGDASARNFNGNNERDQAARNADRLKQRAEAEAKRPAGDAPSAGSSAAAQSIVEAQEATLTDRKIVAAFQARHGITDLLSVIRDPEDRVLPRSPES